MRHSSEIDMCSGPLVGNLLRFSLPLMASGILQLLFNAADIIVLGQFASSSAMAAVGATSSLNSLMVNLFLGLSIGCSVVMAHSYGAQDWRRVQDTVHTAILLALFCGAALILLGLPLLHVLLGWMDTPADLMDQSVLYMRIVFLGMPAMMAYDFGAGILRAIELGVSNARVEAVNNKIKVAIRQGYGFRNIDNLIALVMLRCSDLRPALPGRAAA